MKLSLKICQELSESSTNNVQSGGMFYIWHRVNLNGEQGAQKRTGLKQRTCINVKRMCTILFI